MTTGADPLFFLDYVGAQKLSPKTLSAIIEGMARGCRNAQCALIGGETAEMPGFYQHGEYDIAGTIVGIVERQKLINGSRISEGDVLIGLKSNGLHTNGYSLARKVLIDDVQYDLKYFSPVLGCSLGEELLKVHKSYQKSVIAVRDMTGVVGISHITGGGIEGNTRRLLCNHLKLYIDWNSWEIPPIFNLIQSAGHISDMEMRRVFNLGIGLVFIIQPNIVSDVINMLNRLGEQAKVIGEVIS